VARKDAPGDWAWALDREVTEMRMIDDRRKSSVRSVSMYLTAQEARTLHAGLDRLLQDPEANKHFHVDSEDFSREISCSIITEKKLGNLRRYTRLEQQVLLEE
jgi:hypothetical protein